MARELEVVEAGDGERDRHRDAQLLCRSEHASRDMVGAADDSVWRAGRIDED